MSVSEAASGVVDESVESMELAPDTNEFHLEPRCRICRNDQVRTKVNDLLSQFTGDGIMAVFGAPITLEDHAVRACLAALDIHADSRAARRLSHLLCCSRPATRAG
jgi:class 3 adenylate cyclase